MMDSVVLRVISDDLRCFQMFLDVFRRRQDAPIVHRRSIDILRYIQDVFRCSQMFNNVHRWFWMLSRCSQMFLDVL